MILERLALAAGLAVVMPAIPALAETMPVSGAASDAANFGARDAVERVSLSPDGKSIALIQPTSGRGSTLVIATLGDKPELKSILSSSGNPERLWSCRWSTNTRLVCTVSVVQTVAGRTMAYSRQLALNADGSDLRPLSARTTSRDLVGRFDGGHVIDWLTDGTGAVLATRESVPQQNVGSIIAPPPEGLAVDRVDTLTGKHTVVEQPNGAATDYISDGHGVVRVMGLQVRTNTGYDANRIDYVYRKAGSRDWLPLSQVSYDGGRSTGFIPYAVDPDLDVAYGFAGKDGRRALWKVSLDGSLKRELVFARPDYDVDELVQVGRQDRVVGVSYVDEKRRAAFFDPTLKALAASLAKALPSQPLVSFVDASADESKLLLWAGSDVDPGRFYLYDKATRRLGEVMALRPQLAPEKLGVMKAVSFPAADGTMIPGYLTLPAGSDGRNLPAIVMPHGGPSARDEWNFDWFAQYFVARGFAVLQPNYRGSTGYGTDWAQNNGFRSWRTAIGDIDDGGRWLVSQGIAAPARLAIVGWSYGGYAALQSAVTAPGLFKAAVAVAPVTDLPILVERRRGYEDFRELEREIGTGDNAIAGSPARNAARIAVPVLLFHGDADVNVAVEQSRVMADKLKDAGRPVELVEYPGLTHQLIDNKVRADMLARADAFLRKTMGM